MHTSRSGLNKSEEAVAPKLDQLRDDASVYSRRQRSNSTSSVLNVVPSPTTADYLRNRTRENFNVVARDRCEDFELSQILYDDMAYRQLRKDSDAYRLSQMKAMAGSVNSLNSQIVTPLTSIATLPIGYEQNRVCSSNSSNYSNVKTVKMIKQRDATNKTYRQNLINGYSSNSRDR